jgi:thiol:disulfide interchange protein DsbC
MQLNFLKANRGPVFGAVTLCAIAAAAYLIWSPAGPTVLAPALLASVTPADTFTNVTGDGSRTVHVFVSVDCAFCRKVEPELEHLNNATVRYHLLPGHSASARQESDHVWCAKNQAKAWATAARGGTVESSQCESSALDRNHSLAAKLGIERTPAMVFADGRVVEGALSKVAIERELARSKAGQTK